MALTMLVLMSVLFAVTHIGMSHDPFRARLVEGLGPKGFQVVYSVVSLVTFGVAVSIFAHNRKAGPVLWTTPVWLLPIVYLLMLLAFLLLVLSMRDRSPAMMIGGKMEPEGVLRITRHPVKRMDIYIFRNGNHIDLRSGRHIYCHDILARARYPQRI